MNFRRLHIFEFFFTFLYNEKTEQNILKNLVADVILSMYGRYPLYHSQANIKMNMEEHEMSTTASKQYDLLLDIIDLCTIYY